MKKSKTLPQDIKKLFWKLGTCSQTFFYILNREFGYPMEAEEHASDPLASTMLTGNQCGMLWGSSLAIGAESYRRHKVHGQAIGSAITATTHLIGSFIKRTNSVNCRDITGCDFSKKINMVRYMLKFIFLHDRTCFDLAEKWATDACQSASEGLQGNTGFSQTPISCASEVAKKMGASDEEMIMVAGFAGGLGLSGCACGALSAATWLNTLAWCRKHTGKTGYSCPNRKKILKAFYNATDSEILCHKITGRNFKTIDDHTEFMKNGGCEALINILGRL